MIFLKGSFNAVTLSCVSNATNFMNMTRLSERTLNESFSLTQMDEFKERVSALLLAYCTRRLLSKEDCDILANKIADLAGSILRI